MIVPPIVIKYLKMKYVLLDKRSQIVKLLILRVAKVKRALSNQTTLTEEEVFLYGWPV